MAMISNARLSRTVHSTVMMSLVVAARNCKATDVSMVALERQRIQTVMDFLKALSADGIKGIRVEGTSKAAECIFVLGNALSKTKTV